MFAVHTTGASVVLVTVIVGTLDRCVAVALLGGRRAPSWLLPRQAVSANAQTRKSTRRIVCGDVSHVLLVPTRWRSCARIPPIFGRMGTRTSGCPPYRR